VFDANPSTHTAKVATTVKNVNHAVALATMAGGGM